jgi:hypothetical protein
MRCLRQFADADHGEADEGDDSCHVALEVVRQTAIATDPCESPLDNLSFGKDLESDGIQSFDNLQSPYTGCT